MKTLPAPVAAAALLGLLLTGCATPSSGGGTPPTVHADAPEEADGATQRVDIPMRVWLTTYAQMDNVGNVEQIDGDPALAEHAWQLMERGSQAAAAHPQAGQGEGGWPPLDGTLQMELSAADIEMIRESFRDGIAVTRRILEESDLNESVRQEQRESLALEEEAAAFWSALAVSD